MTVDDIRELIKLLMETGIAELEVQRGENRVRIRRSGSRGQEFVVTPPQVVHMPAKTVPASSESPTPALEIPQAKGEKPVDANVLQKLGKDGYVVNISRGSVIDQPALIAALTDQTIAGAGLDVYEKEPHAPDALTALPNVVLSPHIGGHTLESHVAMQDCVMANLDAYFAGKPLPYAVPLG